MRHNLNEESENTDRWLVSYADFITLLFAFFVVMYSVSQVNEGKFKILSETLTDAFVQPERSLQPIQVGNVNRTETTAPGEGTYPEDYIGEPTTAETDQSFLELREELTNSLSELIEAGHVKIRSNQDWLEVDMRSESLFDSGSDVINPGAIPLIEMIAEKYSGKKNALKIRGYTDNRPIETRRFPSNWALSSARAVAVAQLFERYNIEPSRMTVEGYGEHQPIADNTTAAGRQANRRVVVAFSRTAAAVSELERKASEEAAAEAADPENEVEDKPRINLIRTPDGSLIIRGVDKGTEEKQDNSTQNQTSDDQ